MSFLGISYQAIISLNLIFQIKVCSTEGPISGPLLFLLYVNDMNLTVSCDSSFHADDSYLVYQYRNVTEIEQNLKKLFYLWFVCQ